MKEIADEENKRLRRLYPLAKGRTSSRFVDIVYIYIFNGDLSIFSSSTISFLKHKNCAGFFLSSEQISRPLTIWDDDLSSVFPTLQTLSLCRMRRLV